jgi:hypothetical protein
MEPLLIGKYDIGVQQDIEPFMLPEQAFPNMLNAFVWRGRVQRKAGYENLGRLARIVTGFSLGNTNGAGFASGNLLTAILVTDANSTLAPGTVVVTIGAQVFTDDGQGNLSNGTGGTGTINYLTGAITVQTNPVLAATPVIVVFSYFPARPVMGIRIRENPALVNQEQTIFFDTRYAYIFSGGVFSELPSTLATVWTGNDTQFFWTTNFQKDALNNPLFWATNNNPGNNNFLVTLIGGAAAGPPSTANITTSTANNFQLGDTVTFVNTLPASVAPGTTGTVTAAGNPFTVSVPNVAGAFTNGPVTQGMVIANRLINQNVSGDGIRVYNGTTWANLDPAVDAVTIMLTALMLVPYKDRMVALNVTEGSDTAVAVQQKQRVRWSQNGSAIDGANGWRSDVAGRGGFLDIPTGETIISCGFVKDLLVVYCERSSWILAYTGNEILPFIFQRVNDQLGASATFSATVYDNGLLCFGNVGVHSSNGQETHRIDAVIPDEVFNAKASGDGPIRTYAVRDFYQEICYFAYADDRDNTNGAPGKTFYPNKMMIYNYRNDTFSFFDDNATCFGYFQNTSAVPWSKILWTWANWTKPWNSGVLQAEFPNVAFGNQQGYVEQITPDDVSNAVSLEITAIITDPLGLRITSKQHNLFQEQYVRLHTVNGVTGLNDNIYQIVQVIDENTFIIDAPTPLVGTYIGGGQIEVISEINVTTKMFTPYWQKGNRYELKYIDMLFDRTAEGQLDVGIYIDFDDATNMADPGNSSLLGLPIVSTAAEGTNQPYYSFQSQGAQIWKKFYTYAMGETFQVQLTFNDDQMRDYTIATSEVVLHGMLFHFEQTGAFY